MAGTTTPSVDATPRAEDYDRCVRDRARAEIAALTAEIEQARRNLAAMERRCALLHRVHTSMTIILGESPPPGWQAGAGETDDRSYTYAESAEAVLRACGVPMKTAAIVAEMKRRGLHLPGSAGANVRAIFLPMTRHKDVFVKDKDRMWSLVEWGTPPAPAGTQPA